MYTSSAGNQLELVITKKLLGRPSGIKCSICSVFRTYGYARNDSYHGNLVAEVDARYAMLEFANCNHESIR